MSALATANVALNFKSQNPQSLFVREVRKAKVKAKWVLVFKIILFIILQLSWIW